MKAQAYPPSVIRKGARLYAALYYISDDDKAKVEVTEWIVRSIQKRRNSTSDQRYVNLAQKLDGLRGKGHGRMGTLGLVAIYTELVFEAVPGRWRIAFWRLYDDATGRSQVCESQLAGRGPILRGRAEKPSDRRGYSGNSKRSWRRTRGLLKAAGAMVKRAKQEEKRLTNVTDRLLRSNQNNLRSTE